MIRVPEGYEYLPPTMAAEEFGKDWHAALCPSIDEYLERVHPDLRDEAGDLMLEVVVAGPTPPYSPVQMRRLAEQVAPIIDGAMDTDEWRAAGAECRAEFLALPWYVRRWRRARLSVWLYWMHLKLSSRPPRWM